MRAAHVPAVVLACLLLFGMPGPPASAQEAATPAVTAAPSQEQWDPDLGEEMGGTEPDTATSDVPIDPEEAARPAEEQETVSGEAIEQAGWGSAADQTPDAKRAEAEEDCAGAPPPTSRMLGLPGSVAAGDGGSIGWLVLVIAAGALLVAGVAFALRRRDPKAGRGALESVATVVGILGAIAGLAVQFVPGVGAHQPPSPSAAMAIRDVNARIPHVEYARRVNGELPPPEDRREVGNVIWLEVRMEGYRNREPVLQYGLYDPGAGDALLPGTAVLVPVPHGGEDVETQFLPIWVGYPLSEHFKASFRLLDDGRVQAIAETGRMRASEYRYSCE